MELIIKEFDELSVRELHEIYKLRSEVFVVEQNCVYLDIDEYDDNAIHVYLKENDEIVAYLRILKANTKFDDVSFGRVISRYRRNGTGTKLLKEAIKYTGEILHANRIVIEAQTYASVFYSNVGFRQTSEEFLEDGIPHIKMLLEL